MLELLVKTFESIIDGINPSVLMGVTTVIVSLYIPIAVIICGEISDRRKEKRISIDTDTLLIEIINAKKLLGFILEMIISVAVISFLCSEEDKYKDNELISFLLRFLHFMPLLFYYFGFVDTLKNLKSLYKWFKTDDQVEIEEKNYRQLKREEYLRGLDEKQRRIVWRRIWQNIEADDPFYVCYISLFFESIKKYRNDKKEMMEMESIISENYSKFGYNSPNYYAEVLKLMTNDEGCLVEDEGMRNVYLMIIRSIIGGYYGDNNKDKFSGLGLYHMLSKIEIPKEGHKYYAQTMMVLVSEYFRTITNRKSDNNINNPNVNMYEVFPAENYGVENVLDKTKTKQWILSVVLLQQYKEWYYHEIKGLSDNEAAKLSAIFTKAVWGMNPRYSHKSIQVLMFFFCTMTTMWGHDDLCLGRIREFIDRNYGFNLEEFIADSYGTIEEIIGANKSTIIEKDFSHKTRVKNVIEILRLIIVELNDKNKIKEYLKRLDEFEYEKDKEQYKYETDERIIKSNISELKTTLQDVLEAME